MKQNVEGLEAVRLELQPFDIVQYRKDPAFIKKALKAIPKSRRPRLREERHAKVARTSTETDAAGAGSAPTDEAAELSEEEQVGNFYLFSWRKLACLFKVRFTRDKGKQTDTRSWSFNVITQQSRLPNDGCHGMSSHKNNQTLLSCFPTSTYKHKESPHPSHRAMMSPPLHT